MSEDYPHLILPEGFDERGEQEMQMRGYLSHAMVEVKGGQRYSALFIDPIRLQQDLDEEVRLGRPCLAEPGLIVLPEITLQAIKGAVHYLWGIGFFSRLKPS